MKVSSRARSLRASLLTITLIVWVTMWVCAERASAQRVGGPPPRAVAVIDATAGATSDPEVTGLAGRVEAQLDRETDLVPVGSERRPALVGAVADEQRSAIAEARSALMRGRDALARFDHPEAVKEATRGIARAVEVPPSDETTKLLADLAFVRGLARFDIGDNTGAVADFMLVHRLDAGRALDPVKYVPEVIALFEKAAKPPAMTSLDIEAPAGGDVWIDGKRLGPAPVTAQVSIGLHAIVVTGERLVTRGQVVEAIAGGATARVDAAEASVTMIIHRLRRRLAEATTDQERADATSALVRTVGAQDAIVVGRSSGVVVTWIYSGRTAELGVPQRGTDIEAKEVVKPLRPLRLPRPRGDQFSKVPGPPLPWYRRRWVQVSIGGTIVASVVATVVMIVAQPEGTSVFPGGPTPWDMEQPP